MMRTLAVLERDLRRLLRNPITLITSVLMPLVYLLILGNPLQGPIKGLPLGVVAFDQGPQAREFIGALQAIQRGPHTGRLVRVSDPEHAMDLLRRGELSGFVVVPEHFSSDLVRGRNGAVGLWAARPVPGSLRRGDGVPGRIHSQADAVTGRGDCCSLPPWTASPGYPARS